MLALVWRSQQVQGLGNTQQKPHLRAWSERASGVEVGSFSEALRFGVGDRGAGKPAQRGPQGQASKFEEAERKAEQ